MNITGRTILITGGSAGIGLAFALKFLELGNQVIVTGRRQSVLDELKANYPKLHTIQSCRRAAESISWSIHGPIIVTWGSKARFW
jgi:short-subunit dehydrogenase involved in D-alanine esterification of teichoic acids